MSWLPIADLATTWGGQELRYFHPGDCRLKWRAVAIVNGLLAQPEASLPAAMCSPAATKAAYRFFTNDAVTPQALRQAQADRTRDRLRPLRRAFLLQDTTELDYTTHTDTTGLGELAHPTRRGLLVHSTLALDADGVPLGLLDQQVWTRDPADHGKARTRRQRPQAAKESQRWLTALAASLETLPPTLETITIADREADLFAVFAAPRPAHAHLLIRATHPRVLVEETGTLWTVLDQTPPQGTVTLQVPARPGQPAREATLTLRWRAVTIHPPHRGPGSGVPLTALWAREEAPPPGATPLDWRLLTTLPLADLPTACRYLDWYRFRWRIERFHFILKTGCRQERLQLEDADRLDRALALYSVVAVRLLQLTLLARTTPDAPATVAFSADECAVLQAHFAPATAPPLLLRQAVRWTAQLGGFLGRSGDGEPGPQTLWRGLRRLEAMVDGYRLATQRPPPET
jgi:hypothetical protein